MSETENKTLTFDGLKYALEQIKFEDERQLQYEVAVPQYLSNELDTKGEFESQESMDYALFVFEAVEIITEDEVIQREWSYNGRILLLGRESFEGDTRPKRSFMSLWTLEKKGKGNE